MKLATCPLNCGSRFFINKSDEINKDFILHINKFCFKSYLLDTEQLINGRICFSNDRIELVSEDQLNSHCSICRAYNDDFQNSMIQDSNLSIRIKDTKLMSNALGGKKGNKNFDDSMYEIQMKKLKSMNIRDEIEEESKEENKSQSGDSNFNESML